MAQRFEPIVVLLQAAHRVAARLVREGDARFRPVADNLWALLTLPWDERFPVEVVRRRWTHLPFCGDRGGSWTEPLTPLMEELVAHLGALGPAAVAESPELAAAQRTAESPVAEVAVVHGHTVTALTWGPVIIDRTWLMPQSAGAPARLFRGAPDPHLIGQTGASLWIVDVDGGRWARLEVAPGTAGPHSFLEALEVDRAHVAYDVPAVATAWAKAVLRRKEIRLAEIEWTACWPPEPDLLARCVVGPVVPTRRPATDWGELREFLAAYFGDQSTEEGVREVVFVTAEHPK